MGDQITPIIMPKWGLSMKEGTLAAWHVEEGTQITPGDEIMDVETDKIANVVEAADGGLLRRRVGQAGDVYPVRALLGVMAPESVPDADIDAFVEAFEVPVVEDEEDTGPSYAFTELPVGRIRYAERPGEGTPIVLIHGFGGDLDNWLFNIDALAETAPVYALDLPGHGQSVKAVDNPGVDVLVTTVLDFLNDRGIEKAHLVGHSMGGLVAGKVALSEAARAASLTLICSAGLGEDINADYVDGFVSAVGRKDLKPVLFNLFADRGLVSRSMVDDLLKYKRLDGVQEFLEKLSKSLFPNGKQAVQIADALAGLDCRKQIVWGEKDAIIPNAHADTVTGAAVTTISDAGHMVQMEKPTLVNDLIRDQV